MKIRQKQQELDEHIEFQHYIITVMKEAVKKYPDGLNHVIMHCDITGKPITVGQFFDRHARMLCVLVEKGYFDEQQANDRSNQ